MTEKRFYTDGKYVMQKGETWVVAGEEHSADVIATALNELIEERNKLQFDYNMEVLTRQSVEKENRLLKHENEHLNICLSIEAMYDTSEIELIECIAKNEQLKQSEKDCQEWNHKLINENEQLKKEKEFWKGDACNCSNYLSILSMDCQIVQEAIYNLKNVIDVDTEAFKLLDELDDKFDELNQHRIKMKYSR